MLHSRKFSMKEVFAALIDYSTCVPWRFLLKDNKTRPRDLLTLWLVYHGKLATKDRLKRFNLIQDSIGSLCHEVDEIINHLFFIARSQNPFGERSYASWRWTMTLKNGKMAKVGYGLY